MQTSTMCTKFYSNTLPWSVSFFILDDPFLTVIALTMKFLGCILLYLNGRVRSIFSWLLFFVLPLPCWAKSAYSSAGVGADVVGAHYVDFAGASSLSLSVWVICARRSGGLLLLGKLNVASLTEWHVLVFHFVRFYLIEHVIITFC